MRGEPTDAGPTEQAFGLMRTLRILAISIAGMVGLVALLLAALQTLPGQRLAASLISKAASGPERGLDVSGLSGFFPTEFSAERMTYRDSEGPWLTAENVRLQWSLAPLLGGRLHIESLSADRLTVHRLPVPSQDTTSESSTGMALPLGIEVKRLSIDHLYVSEAMAGVGSDWKVTGNALLPADLSHGKVTLDAHRIDGPQGRLAVDISFDVTEPSIDGEIELTEGPAGVVPTLLERPDIADLSVRLAAHGDANAGTADLTVSAGEAARAQGKARWQPNDGTTAISVQLHTAAPRLLQTPLGAALRQPIALEAEATVDGKSVTISKAELAAGPHGIALSGRYDLAADHLQGKAVLHSSETGAVGLLADGVTWRGVDVEARFDVALATGAHGTIALTGSADKISLAALDDRLPPLDSAEVSTDIKIIDGTVHVDSLDIASPLVSVRSNGSYATGIGVCEVKATVVLPRLSPLSDLAGRPLTGKATFNVTIGRNGRGYIAEWQGTASDVTDYGLPPDALSPHIKLSGNATWRYDQTWALENVRVTTDGGIFRLSGEGRGGTGALDLTVDLPRLHVLQSDLAGAAKVISHIRLSGDETVITLTARLRDIN